MGQVNLVVRTETETKSVSVDSRNLSEFITNVKLYDKDFNWMKRFLDSAENIDILPLDNGIIIIDTIEDMIYDSQGFTGVNKLTPAEIKMSKNGNKVDETSENAIIKRFKDLHDSGRLKGFEEWYDNGTGLNTKVLDMTYDELLDTTLETNVYGQFIFKTTPFKVETYCETDFVEQTQLFNKLIKHEILSDSDKDNWQKYLGKI